MKNPVLVVMVPALNEEKTIGKVVQGIPRKVQGAKEVRVLVIDDGSTDKTKLTAEKAGADRVVRHSSNKGLGVAFRTGINSALEMGADIIVNIDADGQFDSNDIPKLIKPIVDDEAEMVTCTRFGKREFIPEMPALKKFGNGIFTSLINWLTRSKFTDTQCGFRAYSREAALRMNLFGKFTYTQETFLDLVFKGMRIVEVPCKVKGEREGQSRMVKNWLSYSTRALIIIVRTIRDYKPLKFFGSMGVASAVFGSVLLLWLFLRWLSIGQTFPFTSLILVSVLFILGGFILLVLALIADMNYRQRRIQEEILYEMRKKRFEKQVLE